MSGRDGPTTVVRGRSCTGCHRQCLPGACQLLLSTESLELIRIVVTVFGSASYVSASGSLKPPFCLDGAVTNHNNPYESRYRCPGTSDTAYRPNLAGSGTVGRTFVHGPVRQVGSTDDRRWRFKGSSTLGRSDAESSPVALPPQRLYTDTSILQPWISTGVVGGYIGSRRWRERRRVLGRPSRSVTTGPWIDIPSARSGGRDGTPSSE